MRGQLWSTDFIVSATMFFTVLFLVIFVWNYTNTQGRERLEFNSIETLALTVSDAIIRTPGLPEDWNASNVRVLGIASDDNVLNSTKVLRFVNLPYSNSRALISQKYQFYFELRNTTGEIIENSGTNLTTGVYPFDPSIVVPIDRFVVYEDKIATMKLIVWS
ncbi:MAG: hypothetical protein ABIJ92_04030 [Candidatus Aenigmatarchaeota archaeon]